MQTVRVNTVRNVDPKYVARLERELAHLRAVVDAMQRKDGAALRQATERVMVAEAGSAVGGGSESGRAIGVEGPAGEEAQVSQPAGVEAPAATEAVALLEDENASLRRELGQVRARAGGGQQRHVEAAQTAEQLQDALSTAAALWDAVRAMRDAAHQFFSLDIEEDQVRSGARTRPSAGSASPPPLSPPPPPPPASCAAAQRPGPQCFRRGQADDADGPRLGRSRCPRRRPAFPGRIRRPHRRCGPGKGGEEGQRRGSGGGPASPAHPWHRVQRAHQPEEEDGVQAGATGSPR